MKQRIAKLKTVLSIQYIIKYVLGGYSHSKSNNFNDKLNARRGQRFTPENIMRICELEDLAINISKKLP